MYILYAPGMGKDMSVLQAFREELLNHGYTIDCVKMLYDHGNLAFDSFDSLSVNYRWWVGISLGASIMYYWLSNFPPAYIPERLTLINPFYDRKKLSVEKGFSMNGQWDISLVPLLHRLETLDVVVSLYDRSIPIYHGIKLLNASQAYHKHLIFVEADHQIKEESKQKELADMLLNIEKGASDVQYNYCHIYKQYGTIFTSHNNAVEIFEGKSY